MVHHEELQQSDSTSPTDNSTESNEKLMPNDTERSSQQEPPSSSSELSPTIQNATTTPPSHQEELGKSFASRKIQVASLAIRSSHSASQSPLFPKHDMLKLYQQPFVASSLSTPTSTFAPITSTTSTTTAHHSNDKQRSLPQHLLSSSSLTTTDRALLDRTWSVLAPKSELNQQHRKKPRRRVTFNDNIEFFELPPQMHHYDDLAPPPTYTSSPTPPPVAATEATESNNYMENQKEHHQDIEKGKPPTPQIANQWDESYTDASNESSSPGLQTTDIPKQINSYPAPSSVTSSTSTTSSNSMATLSLSSSSTQSNSITNNNNNTNSIATSYDRRSPSFNQHINASTSSLPAYNPLSSSTISLALSTSSSPNSTTTDTQSSQMTLQRKGNSISRNAILEILSSRTPSSHHRFTPGNNRRSIKHNSKRLSIHQQQQPHHQVPVGFHHTLDSVENEIKEAIQRAKASNVKTNVKKLAPKSPIIDKVSSNDKKLHDANELTMDLETTKDAITTGGDDNDSGDPIKGLDSAEDDDNNDNRNQRQLLLSGDSMDEEDQLYSVDDSDSNTLHGENNSNETIYVDADDRQDGEDEDNVSSYHDTVANQQNIDKTLLISAANEPSSLPCNLTLNNESDTRDSDYGGSDEDNYETNKNHTSNDLLAYLPSSEQQACDFGDTLRDEFDRITSDVTQMVVPASDPTTANMELDEPQANVSTVSIAQDDQMNQTETKNDQEQTNPSIAWRILGCQDENDAPSKHQQQDNDQPQKSTQNGRLYIKVIAAENLDFPINQNAPSIQCSVNDGSHYLGSGHYKMQHNIHFNHEFILDGVNPDTEFTLTLHAIRPVDQNAETSPTKRWSKRTSFGGGDRADDLSRYINRQDGALAQTRVSLSAVSYQCRTRLCTAAFALVNGWYQPVKKSGTRHPLLLSRATKDKRHLIVQEKAVGKLTMELFYLPNAEIKISDLPVDMDSCENALNIQRFHKTIWRSGYMSQLGGDVKYWRRRYFKLIGGQLYSYTDTLYSPRTVIDLSKAVVIASDNRIVMETNSTNQDRQQQQHQSSSNVFENDVGHNLLMALEYQTNINNNVERECHHHFPYRQPHQNNSTNNNVSGIANNSQPQESSASASAGVSGGSSTSVHVATTINQDLLRRPLGGDDDLSSYSVKNSFQVKFDNGEMIEFFCDSAHERERWLDVLKVILGRIPTLPSWLSA